MGLSLPLSGSNRW